MSSNTTIKGRNSASFKMLGQKEGKKNEVLCSLFTITSLPVMKLCWPIRKTVPPLLSMELLFSLLFFPRPTAVARWLCRSEQSGCAATQPFPGSSLPANPSGQEVAQAIPQQAARRDPPSSQWHKCQENCLPGKLGLCVATEVFSQAA